MTVKEVLALLAKMPDHEVKLMIDCPHCGHSKEIKRVEKIVILEGEDEPA